MGDCRNLSICSNVQITKYLNVSNRRQISSKSWNLWFFLPKFGRKVAMSRQAVFCPNFISTPISTKLPIFHIYHLHFHTLSDPSRQSICWRHISLDVCEREWITIFKSNRAISLVQFLPKYPSTRWKWEVRMNPECWVKNNYGTKLREALPNHHQILSKQEIWKAIFEHLNR